MNITEKELKLLRAIYNDDFQDGEQDTPGNQIWANCCDHGLGKSAGGVMASLVEKGLAGTTGNSREDCWWLTASGIAEVKARA